MREKHDLPFTLFADENGEVVEKYDAKSWLPGKSARAVTVIDKEGIVRSHQVQSLRVFRPNDEEVLAAIRGSEKIIRQLLVALSSQKHYC